MQINDVHYVCVPFFVNSAFLSVKQSMFAPQIVCCVLELIQCNFDKIQLLLSVAECQKIMQNARFFSVFKGSGVSLS